MVEFRCAVLQPVLVGRGIPRVVPLRGTLVPLVPVCGWTGVFRRPPPTFASPDDTRLPI